MADRSVKIVLTGGGTGGSVTPLLALAESPPPKNQPGADFIWIGTRQGIENAMVASAGLPFHWIFAGKWRRYFSWRNFFDIFLTMAGLMQSLWLMARLRPRLVVTAGSFVGVPVAWAAWVFRIPVIVHQQDAVIGLANRLTMRLAAAVTVSLKPSLKEAGDKAVWTGNPVRQSIIEAKQNQPAAAKGLPVVVIVGGGTGAAALNKLVGSASAELSRFCRLVLVAGRGKAGGLKETPRLAVHEFLPAEAMALTLAAADLVVTRAGMSFLSEIACLRKPAIVIPMPGTHQEDNAAVFFHARAAVVLDEAETTPAIFTAAVKKLIDDDGRRRELVSNLAGVMPPDANQALWGVIDRVLARRKV